MRIARLGPPGAECPVVEAPDGSLRDLTPITSDVDGAFLGTLLQGGAADLDARVPSLPAVADEDVRRASPVVRPGKVVGIGLNYACHAAETGQQPPAEPVVFLKASTSVCGPTDDIVLVPGSVHTDYEVELGVVLGAPLRGQTDPERALAAVAGYVLAHDVSDRRLQLESGGTWTKGKSADTFCPLGPWLVTADELVDPTTLDLALCVDGDPRQRGRVADMVFSVPEILCYVSGLMTLEAGDVIVTGTPAGVAMARPEPRPYLRHGQVVELDGGVLGRQRSRVVDPLAVATAVQAG